MSTRTPDDAASGEKKDDVRGLSDSSSTGQEANDDKESAVSGTEDDQKEEKEFILVDWEGGDIPRNPRDMSHLRKWIIVIIIAASSFCVTMNSSIYTFTYDQLESQFNVSREVATLGLTLFVLGLAVGPMVLAPLSEFYGRRVVYIGALSMVFLFVIPCAVAQNIQTIIITRFFDGIFASAFLSVAGGTIGDIFDKRDLALPMLIYTGSPFMGPALGPVIGGFINSNVSWRWTFWVVLIFTGVQICLLIIIIPETYHPVLLRRKAQRLRKETGNQSYRAQIEITDKTILSTILWSCIRPLQLLTLEPMTLCLCTLSALLLGILYLFFGAFILVFQTNHGFNLWQSGLCFLGLFVGMLFGLLTDPFWKWNYTRLLRNNSDKPGELGPSEPEFRLPQTIFGTWTVVVGLFGFAWTSFSFVHWIVPLIFSGFFGCGTVVAFAGIFTFQVESYPLYAASSLAANSIARSIFAATFPLFGVQMYEALGFQWASSLLGFLALALAPFPYIFFRYGKRIRAKSRFKGAR